jgi:hypothetical protein
VDRALTGRPEPICTGSCHSGDFRDFDHYCDSVNATDEEVPIAFAAWLNAITGGKWDGDAGPIPDVD